MKTVITILIALFSFTGFIYADEFPKQYTVTHIEYTNAQWEIPPDGGFPLIHSFHLEMTLNNEYELSAVITRNEVGEDIVAPFDFIQFEDRVDILQEGFMLDVLDRSWFRVLHGSTGIEFDAQGNSIKSKVKVPVNTSVFAVEDVRLYEARPFEVSFKLDSIYFVGPVDSNKYHGFYDDMPVEVLSFLKTDEDQNGDFQYHVVLENIENKEVMEFASYQLNDFMDIQISNFGTTNESSWGHSYYPEIFYFNLELTLDNGQQYKTAARYKIYYEKNMREQFIAKFIEEHGVNFSILSETPKVSDGRQSSFLIQSDKSGETFRISGPARLREPSTL